MMMSETLGNYGERAGECEYLTLAFSPVSAPAAFPLAEQRIVRRFSGRLRDYISPANGALPDLQNAAK